KDLLTGDTRMNRPGLADYLGGIIENASTDAAIAGAHALAMRPDSRPTLSQIAVPTLIFTGLEDSIYPFEVAQEMDAAISNSTLAIPAGAAHAAIIEAGSEANEAIRDWAEGIQ
ncbi:MAG: alpha/beta fold hydrolase, partial [Rhodothermales bacterium]